MLNTNLEVKRLKAQIEFYKQQLQKSEAVINKQHIELINLQDYINQLESNLKGEK